MSEAERLDAASAAFAADVETLLRATLPGEHEVRSREEGGRYVVSPPVGPSSKPATVPLFVDGEELAKLHFSFRLGVDSAGEYLKATRADFHVLSTLDSKPLARLEYQSDIHTAPIAHWQVHGERGALTHLMTHANTVRPRQVARPHDMSSLHFPVGGERFRPCLEDFIEFLIRELGVDRVSGWDDAIASGRMAWRRKQLRAAVRDLPAEAADILRTLGWHVAPPGDQIFANEAVLTKW
ncbi:hypothetical protein [Microbacterium sp. KNMS]